MTGGTYPDKWREAFSQGLPGVDAQMKMAPAFRGEYENLTDPVPAAVLILIYPVEEELRLVLMKRNAYDGPHSAQVSFPGGAWEQSDDSLSQTALRETREELGVTGKIELLGSLTPLHIPVSNFLVHPFAGWMAERPVFQPDQSEVQYIIETSIGFLQDRSNILSNTWHHHGSPVLAPYYRVENEKIWGATAMMLCEFLQLAARMQSHRY